MTKKTVLIVGGVALGLGAVAVASVVLINRRKEKLDQKAAENEFGQSELSQPSGNEPKPNPSVVVPEFNRNNELSNPLNQLMGKTLYPKTTANIRSEARVNNGMINNILTTIKSPNTAIGKVIGDELGQENPPMRWFAVELKEPIKVYYWAGLIPMWTTHTKAFVRADVVTFK